MAIQDKIFGKPLATSEERAEQIGVGGGIPIFGLDALTSAAYGPEAALALLIPLGMQGTQYLLPIVISILILLVIVFFSYRQTIAAYPSGGGSYTVASENIRSRAHDRLHSDCGRRHFSGRHRHDVRPAQIRTAYAGHLPHYPGHSGGREPAGGKRHGNRFHYPDLIVYRNVVNPDRSRRL
jgi:hypothetical protein